jgi:hypothetical protein
MGALQFVIDSLFSKLTVEQINGLTALRLSQGPFEIAALIAPIQDGDGSLDLDSAKKLAETAVGDQAPAGGLSIEGDSIFASVPGSTKR